LTPVKKRIKLKEKRGKIEKSQKENKKIKLIKNIKIY